MSTIPDGAVVVSSSTTRTTLPDSSIKVEEVITYRNADGSTSTIANSTIQPAETEQPLSLAPKPTSDASKPLPPSSPNTIGVALNRDQDYNAVIEYYGSRAGTITNRNVAYVATNPRDLPFPVFHESDRVLAFVKANVEAYASHAYLYSDAAWTIRDDCGQKVNRRNGLIFVVAVLVFFLGTGIYTSQMISTTTNCDDGFGKDGDPCGYGGVIFGAAVAVIGFGVMMVHALSGAFGGAGGPTGVGTSNKILSELEEKRPSKAEINKYSFELVQFSSV